LGVDFFPDGLFGVDVAEREGFDGLEVGTDPDGGWDHIFFDDDVGHFDIADLERTLLFGLLFFGLFFVFDGFLGQLLLLFFTFLQLLGGLGTEVGLDDERGSRFEL
jgi:hypothetical protein